MNLLLLQHFPSANHPCLFRRPVLKHLEQKVCLYHPPPSPDATKKRLNGRKGKRPWKKKNPRRRRKAGSDSLDERTREKRTTAKNTTKKRTVLKAKPKKERKRSVT